MKANYLIPITAIYFILLGCVPVFVEESFMAFILIHAIIVLWVLTVTLMAVMPAVKEMEKCQGLIDEIQKERDDEQASVEKTPDE